MSQDTEIRWMKECLRLARRGEGKVSPNPMVGAVLVRDGTILARGYHRRFGAAHAEVDCLDRFNGNPEAATLYVNLEPCSHHGKTPPCVERIIRSGITHVVCGMTDPNPLVSGKGIRRLRNAGVHVTVGILEKECSSLNRSFQKIITTGLPFITVKVAQTIDGKITSPARWITGPQARTLVHRWRAAHDAVLVGAGTVLADDPRLDVRLCRGRDPAVVLLDGRFRTPVDSRLFRVRSLRRIIVVTSLKAASQYAGKVDALRKRSVEVVPFRTEGYRAPLRSVLRRLGKTGITSILVEGGSDVFGSVLYSGLADELAIFISPCLSGDGLPSFSYLPQRTRHMTQHMNLQDRHRVGDDLLLTYTRA